MINNYKLIRECSRREIRFMADFKRWTETQAQDQAQPMYLVSP